MFNLNLTLSGNPAVESRRGAPTGNYSVVFMFDKQYFELVELLRRQVTAWLPGTATQINAP